MPDDRASRPAHYWFGEGFSDYYARTLMVRAGVTSPGEFVAQWNEMLTAYAGSPARTMNGAQATATFWDNYAAEKLPYQRGALLAAMWNARLLAASRGARNLDTIMHAQAIAARTSKVQATVLFRSIAKREGLDILPEENRYLTAVSPLCCRPTRLGRVPQL